jgi:magnesium chelatase family protein
MDEYCAEEDSVAIRERVGRARERQRARFDFEPRINCNARMGTRHLKQHCKLNDESQELIRVAMTELNLSARAYDRILKVARTVADLHGGRTCQRRFSSEEKFIGR